MLEARVMDKQPSLLGDPFGLTRILWIGYNIYHPWQWERKWAGEYVYRKIAIYIHICVYIYIHTYIHAYIHTYITYIHYITLHYIHTYIHYIHYIHTYIHTYIYNHICIICTTIQNWLLIKHLVSTDPPLTSADGPILCCRMQQVEPWDERSHVRPLPTDFACSDAKCGKPQVQSQIVLVGY